MYFDKFQKPNKKCCKTGKVALKKNLLIHSHTIL